MSYLRIVRRDTPGPLRPDASFESCRAYANTLGLLAVAEAMMAPKNKLAQEHFIAIVKEIERVYGFEFERVREASDAENEAELASLYGGPVLP